MRILASVAAARFAERHIRRSPAAVAAGLGIAFAVLCGGSRTACAQQQPPLLEPPPPASAAPASGLQVIAMPFLWLGGVNASINTPLARAPVVNSSVSAFQMLGHLDAIPFMGAAEIRDGPFSLLSEGIHVPVGTNITTRDVFFDGGRASLVTDIASAVLLYHVIDQPVQSLDGGVGARIWNISSRLTLNGGLLPTQNVNRSANWGDPLIAARYHREVGDGFGLTAYADVGGFGVSAHADWQLLGTVDYTLKPAVTLRLGYANLNVSASGGTLGYVLHMKGPIIMANLRF